MKPDGKLRSSMAYISSMGRISMLMPVRDTYRVKFDEETTLMEVKAPYCIKTPRADPTPSP